jgi:adenine deaminase
MPVDVAQLLSVARGDTPADLVLRGGQIVNVFSGEIERGDIAIRRGSHRGRWRSVRRQGNR